MTKVLHILSYNKLAAALVFVLMFVCYGNMSGQVKNVIPFLWRPFVPQNATQDSLDKKERSGENTIDL